MRWCPILLVSLFVGTPILAQPGGVGLLGGSGGGSEKSGPSGTLLWAPTQPVEGTPYRLGWVRLSSQSGLPLWQSESGDDRLFGTLANSTRFLQTDAFFPDSGNPVPKTLYRLNPGVLYTHKFENDWTGGAMFSLGTASDRPYHSTREVNPLFLGFLRVPTGERDFWNFSLMYSPGGQIAFPLPGVSYSWNPSDTFRMNVGLPLSLWWKPADDWTIDLSYMLLTTVHARVTWQALGNLAVYGGFDWQNEAYFLSGRLNRNERLFVDEKRIEAGVRFTVFEHIQIDVTTGYGFDRTLFRGEQFFGTTFDRLNVGSGVFLGLKGSWQF